MFLHAKRGRFLILSLVVLSSVGCGDQIPYVDAPQRPDHVREVPSEFHEDLAPEQILLDRIQKKESWKEFFSTKASQGKQLVQDSVETVQSADWDRIDRIAADSAIIVASAKFLAALPQAVGDLSSGNVLSAIHKVVPHGATILGLDRLDMTPVRDAANSIGSNSYVQSLWNKAASIPGVKSTWNCVGSVCSKAWTGMTTAFYGAKKYQKEIRAVGSVVILSNEAYNLFNEGRIPLGSAYIVKYYMADYVPQTWKDQIPSSLEPVARRTAQGYYLLSSAWDLVSWMGGRNAAPAPASSERMSEDSVDAIAAHQVVPAVNGTDICAVPAETAAEEFYEAPALVSALPMVNGTDVCPFPDSEVTEEFCEVPLPLNASINHAVSGDMEGAGRSVFDFWETPSESIIDDGYCPSVSNSSTTICDEDRCVQDDTVLLVLKGAPPVDVVDGRVCDDANADQVNGTASHLEKSARDAWRPADQVKKEYFGNRGISGYIYGAYSGIKNWWNGQESQNDSFDSTPKDVSVDASASSVETRIALYRPLRFESEIKAKNTLEENNTSSAEITDCGTDNRTLLVKDVLSSGDFTAPVLPSKPWFSIKNPWGLMNKPAALNQSQTK